MRRRVFSWLLITGLILGFYGRISAQEILLDRGIKAGKLDCFPVYGDEKTFYYLPANPRLATVNGKPQFSFIKYVKNVPRGGEGGTTEGEGGGLVHFLVLYGATDQERAEAEQEIQRQVAGAHLVGPVIYRTGTFALVTSFRKENDELVKEVVGMGKAPIMEGHKASVSMHLTQRGATLLWESFRNPTSQISVTFEMEARGYRNPYEATLEADWKKISNSHRVAVGAKYKWLGIDVDLLFQEFRKTGALKLEVKGKSEEMDKIWQKAFDILMKQMFEKDETLDALSSLQKGDSGFNNLDRAMDFLKKDQERKAKEKKGSASLPMSMLERPVLTWPSDAAEYSYSDDESAVSMAGPFDDEALEQDLNFIGSRFSPGKISGRSRTVYQTEEARRKALAKKYFKNGISHFKRENYHQAADQFIESYETYHNFRLFYNIGLCYNNAGFKNTSTTDFEQAEDYLKKFLKGMEEESPPHDWEGKEKQKKWSEGALDFYLHLKDLGSIYPEKGISSGFEEELKEWQQIQYKKTGGKDEQALDDIKKKELPQQEANSTVDETSVLSSAETAEAKDLLDNAIKNSFSDKGEGAGFNQEKTAEGSNQTEEKKKKGEEYFKKGKKYIVDGLYKEAIKEFENSYKEYPSPKMLFNIGLVYKIIADKGESSEENYKKAIDYLEKSIEGSKKEGISSQKDVKDAETKIANIKAAVKDIISKREKAKEAEAKKAKAEAKKAPPAAKAKTPAKKAGEAQKGKAKPADKKKAPAKQPKKAEKSKGDKSSPGFAIIASYRMRRIKHSGKAVINLNQWTQESLVFRFDENIGGLSKYIDNPSFFRAVNLDDPVYKQREVVVMLDGQDSEDFNKYINYVTVQIRKEHENGELTHDELKVDRSNFNSDTNRFMMMYGWKGDNKRDDWLEYRYRTQWSFHGGVQKQEDWKTSNDFVITVTPPHRYRRVILETDPSVFKDRGVRDASIKFYSKFYGKEMVKQVTIRTRENVFTKELEYAHPEGNFDYEYEITWHLRGGVVLKSGRLKNSSDVIYCDELPAEDKTLY